MSGAWHRTGLGERCWIRSGAAPAARPTVALEPSELLPRLRPEALILADRECPQLALQPAVAVPALPRERSVLERRLHRATGLALVRAVPEPALDGEIRDVGERLVQRVLTRPELQ